MLSNIPVVFVPVAQNESLIYCPLLLKKEFLFLSFVSLFFSIQDLCWYFRVNTSEKSKHEKPNYNGKNKFL